MKLPNRQNCTNLKVWERKGRLTGVVDAGEEAVIREFLADVVQLDAEVGDAALVAHEIIAERIPLPS